MTLLEQLTAHLSRLPGLGQKSASRLVHYLLKADATYVHALSALIRQAKDAIHPCTICGNYTEAQECEICGDSRRDRHAICVVEDAKDIETLESTGEYRGLYHVLGGAISPIDGVGPGDLRISGLLDRVRTGEVDEVVLATNPTVEGETTAHYLVGLLKEGATRVTRLAFGLPVGGDLEYADRLTLARALKGRNILD